MEWASLSLISLLVGVQGHGVMVTAGPGAGVATPVAGLPSSCPPGGVGVGVAGWLGGGLWVAALWVGLLWLSLCVSGGQGAKRTLLHYQVEEEAPSGTEVGDVRGDSNLQRKYPQDVFERLQFSFLDSAATGGRHFSIHPSSGVITTTDRIDREKLVGCARSPSCSVSLDVALQPVDFFQIIKVTVEILDVNDNSPAFVEYEMTHPVLESAARGSSFLLPTASDPDSPLFGVTRYQLEAADDTFRLHVTEKMDGAFDVRLMVSQELDREQISQYRVKLLAYDGGVPPKSGAVHLVLPILDSNDNSPQFENATYDVSIQEGMGAGVVVVRVRATDRDIGQNARLVYAFSGQTQRLYGHLVAINNRTGDIVVTGDIDRETTDVINLIVTARDEGPDAIAADATVVVRVVDANDNAPLMSVSTLGGGPDGVALVSEDAAVGTFVAHVSVSDADDGDNGLFNCSLSDFTFSLRQTYDSEYQVVTSRPLDREAISQYGVELVCRDRGSPPQVAIRSLLVSVLDANDNDPVFSKSSYVVTVMEQNEPQLGIIQVQAVDRDAGRNADVTYRLSDQAGDFFTIERRSGAIKASMALDRERHQQFHFHVIASDHGSPPRSASALVIVNVDDLNDEVPQFVRPSFSFRVLENEPIGTDVGKVTAVDKDSPRHNQFMYDVVPGRSDAKPFHVNTRTGRITTSEELDREAQAVYRMVVKATDNGTPPMFSTSEITIFILDKNDNAPRFEFPSPSNHSVMISDKVPVGHHVTQLTAHDGDAESNGRVTYTVLRGNEEGVFTVDTESGVMTVSSPLSERDSDVFSLFIRAEDHGSPALRTEQQLRVVVNSSLPYPPHSAAQGHDLLHYNIIVIVAVACGGAVITVSVIVGILLVRHHGRRSRLRKYNCRMEAQRMLNNKDGNAGDEHIPMKNGPKVSTLTRQLSGEPPPGVAVRVPGVAALDGHAPETPLLQQLCAKPHLLAGSHPDNEDPGSTHSGRNTLPHRKDGNLGSYHVSGTLPSRQVSHAYPPPPPPPPNRLRTFSPDGRLPQSPERTVQGQRHVVDPHALYSKPMKGQSREQENNGSQGNHLQRSNREDPWQQHAPVVTESVIV